MDDGFMWLMGMLTALVLVSMLAIGYSLGKVSIVDNCEAIKVFHFDKKVYDCSVRNTK